ncbi:NACHT domain-containing protein [Desulfitobacterium sp. Sab5]|uniref:NACHT domain-containing protein n=1 Tax=Desulfitobacterium nosdiversum TaxID=3375356 RepID=UPI003CF3FFF2
MIKDLKFKEVCNLLKKDDGTLIDLVDKLMGAAIVFSPIIIGPEALPILGLLATKNELTKIGKSLLEKYTSKKDSDYIARMKRMEVAYGLICFTSFFEALDQLLPDDILKKIDLTIDEKKQIVEDANEKSKISEIENDSAYDCLKGGILEEPLSFPHPIVPFKAETVRLEQLYEQMTQSFFEYLRKISISAKDNNKIKESIKKLIKELPKQALDCYRSQYFELARKFNDFCLWSQIREHKITQGALENVSLYMKYQTSLLDESSKKIDFGFNKLQEIVLTIPNQFNALEVANVVNGLKRDYENRINDPIIEDYVHDDGKPALNFPKISEAFIPQSYRVLRYTKQNKHLEREETWENLEAKNDLGFFLVSYLSSPYSIETPLLILGHPGSGKSVLTKVLSARLMSELYTPIRVPLREVNADLPTEDKIEYIINRTTGHKISSWAHFSSQFADRPLVIILDGYDELLQVSGKVYAGYLKEVQQFQKREAEQGRPVRVIVTSRVTLIDKTAIPEGATVLRLMEFDKVQRNAWISIWNKANENYFNSCEPKIRPFELPENNKNGNVEKIISLAEQPLLLLMLALYDSDGNSLRKLESLDRTLLYDSLLRRFIERERRRYVKGFDQLIQKDNDTEIDREMQRLGVAAISMYNRRQLHILSSELNSDLKFFNLERKITVDDGRPMSQADLLLGSFFFIHKSETDQSCSEFEQTEGDTAFEFLHNTFGEFLTADFIMRFALQETEALHSLKQLESLRAELQKKIQDPDGLIKDWFACLIYSPLYTRPVVIEMLRDWSTHILHKRGCKREDFINCLNEIVESQIDMILKGKHFPSMLRNKDVLHVRELPLLGHIAIYTLNLIIMRTVLDDKSYVFDEDCYRSNAKSSELEAFGTRAWDQLTYIWRSWFPLDNLNGLSAILSARREGSKIILTRKETFRVDPSDDRLDIVLNVASMLADNITSGVVGLFSCNSDENDLVEVEKQLSEENIHLRFEFLVRRLRRFLLSESGSFNSCDELVIDGFRLAFKERQRGTLIAEFIDLAAKAFKMKCLSFNDEVIREMYEVTASPRFFYNIIERQPAITLEWLGLVREIGGSRWIKRISDELFDRMIHTGYFSEIMYGQPKVALEWIRLFREISGSRLIKRTSNEVLERIADPGYIREIMDRRPEVAIELLRLIREIGGSRWIKRISDEFFEGMMHTGYIREIMARSPEVALEWIRLLREFGGSPWIDRISDEFFDAMMHTGYIREIMTRSPEVALEWIRLLREFGGSPWIDRISDEFFDAMMHTGYIREIMARSPEVALEWIRLLREFGGSPWIDRISDEFFDAMMHTGYIREIMARPPEVALEWIRLLREFGEGRWIDRIGDKVFEGVIHEGNIGKIISSQPEASFQWLRLIWEVGGSRWIDRIGDEVFEEIMCSRKLWNIMKRRPEITLEWIRLVREVGGRQCIERIGDDFYKRIIIKNLGSVPLGYVRDVKWYADITCNSALLIELEHMCNDRY